MEWKIIVRGRFAVMLRKSRIMALVTVLFLALALFPATAYAADPAYGGDDAGSGLSWSFDPATGQLSVFRTDGDDSSLRSMRNFTEENPAPWASLAGSITSVSIGDGVKSVGACSFGGCSSLRTIALPDTITSIGSGAFKNCLSMQGVLDLASLPSLETIGKGAFSNCSSLGGLTLPDGLKTIDASAFANCKNMSGALDIPESVRTINAMAFSGCEKFTSLELHEGLNYIKDNAFVNCKGLTGTLTIPGSVTSVNTGAFMSCTGLDKIILSDGVQIVGEDAFRNCSGVDVLEIADSLQSFKDNAFLGCGSSELEIKFEGSEDDWYRHKFSYAFNYQAPDPAPALTDSTVSDPGRLSFGTPAVPDRVLITFDLNTDDAQASVTPSHVNTNDDGKLASLPAATRPGYVFLGWYTRAANGSPVTLNTEFTRASRVYAYWAASNPGGRYVVSFDGNGGVVPYGTVLTNAGGVLGTLPTPVRVGYVFDGWYTAPTGGTPAPHVSNIMGFPIGYVFSDNTTLYAHWSSGGAYDITFNANGGQLGSDMQSVIRTGSDGKLPSLPAPTRSGYVFAGWWSGNGSPDYGSQVTGSTVFSSDSTVYARWSTGTYDIIFDPNGGQLFGSLVQADGRLAYATGTDGRLAMLPVPVDSAGRTFGGWWTDPSGGTRVTRDTVFSAGCTLYARWSGGSMGDASGDAGGGVFWEYSGSTGVLRITGSGRMKDFSSSGAPWYDYRSGIQSVEIASGVTKIGQNAFRGCTALASVSIPGDGIDPATGAVIPGVSEIGDYAFEGCSSLTSVSVPASVTKLGSGAFRNCRSLSSASLLMSADSIGYAAFEGCTALPSVVIPASVRHVGGSAFASCTSLASVLMPDGVQDIGPGAFRNCSALASVSIPPMCGLIDASAFEYCTSLASVGFAASGCVVETIGDKAFNGCTALTGIVLPDSLTSLGGQAFMSCVGLTSIEIPSGVSQIGYNAFNGCTNLASVTLPAALKIIKNGAFSGCAKITSIEIPTGTTEICADAFAYCESLALVRFDPITPTVEHIRSGAFRGCRELGQIDLPATLESLGDRAFSGCTSLAGVGWNCGAYDPATGLAGTCTVGNGVFDGCIYKPVTAVDVP